MKDEQVRGYPETLAKEETIKLPAGVYGVCSDLHLGSPYFNNHLFEDYLRFIRKKGGEDILIAAGDILEFSDFNNGRVSPEDYLNNLKTVRNILDQFGMRIISPMGNHDNSLKSHYKNFFDEALVVLGDKIKLFDSEELTIKIGPYYIVVVHSPPPTIPQGNDKIIITGHTNSSFVSSRIINPGTFRDHFSETISLGGMIIDFNKPQFLVERYGEETSSEKEIKNGLLSLGFNPEIVNIDSSNAQYQRLKLILKELRMIDKDCIVWVTGSTVFGRNNNNLGLLNNRYKIEKLEDGSLQIRPTAQNNRPLYGMISDLDIEVIGKVISREDAYAVLTKVAKTLSCLSPQRIELCCYRPDEVLPYLSPQINQMLSDYFVYRLLLAPIGVLDQDQVSLEKLLSLQRQALASIEAGLHESRLPLNQLPTVKVALGYIKFKEIKHQLKLEGESSRNPINVPPQSSLADYLGTKIGQQPWQALPPYTDSANGSFKIIFPDFNQKISYFGESGPLSDVNDLIIAPPLTAYENKVHFGQLLMILTASAVARYEGKSFNPLTFQVTGPYWDGQYFREGKIPEIVDKNISAIVSDLSKFGLEGMVIKDSDPENLQAFEKLLKVWEGLGLIEERENDYDLRTGMALILFGGLRIFSSANLPQVFKVIEDYMKTGKTIPINSFSSNGVYSMKVDEKPVYPTFSILLLSYLANGSIPKESVEVITGENTVTQFGIAQAIVAATLGVPRIDLTSLRLVMDGNGQRMTRRNRNIPYLDNLRGITDQLTPFENENEENLTLMYGILRLGSVDRNLRFDERLFDEGKKCFNKLRYLIAYAKAHNLNINIFDQLKGDNTFTPNGFNQLMRERRINKAVKYFNDSVSKLSRDISNKTQKTKEEILLEYHCIIYMLWVLFGKLGKNWFNSLWLKNK